MGTIYCDDITESLVSGASTRIDCFAPLVSSGNHLFKFDVDYDNKVQEYNENNNIFTKALFVVGEVENGGPDLKIISIAADPSNPTTDDELEFNLTVKNVGTNEMGYVSRGIITRIYSESLPDPHWRICDAMISSLGAGETAVINCPIFQTLIGGSEKFTFSIDDGNRLSETNENNNSKDFFFESNIITEDARTTATLAVSNVSPKTGETFYYTVTGKDDDGVKSVALYINGKWNTVNCYGKTTCSERFSINKSTSGTYRYYGYVFAYDANKRSIGMRTNPYASSISVSNLSGCTETDGGLNYYTKGSIQAGSYGRVDVCKSIYTTQLGDVVKSIGDGGGASVSSGPYLYEAYCDGGPSFLRVIQCDCENGACK